jgi:integration host factor subunit alpha
LSRIIQQKIEHLSFTQARSLVDEVFSIISDEIISEREVKLRGFGSFKIRRKRERPGCDPRTGAYAPVCARKVVFLNHQMHNEFYLKFSFLEKDHLFLVRCVLFLL